MHELNFEYNGKNFGLDIKSAGQEHCLPRKKHEQGSRNYYSLHFVMHGMGTLCVNGVKQLLGKGSLFILYANEKYEYYPDSFNPWSYIWIDFYGDNIDELLSHCGFSREKPYVKIADYQTLTDHFKHLIENYGIGRANTFATFAYTMLVFEQLIEHHERYSKNDKQHSVYYKQFIDTLTYINNNYRLNMSLDQIAEDLNLSKRQIIYMFKKNIGLTPIEYLNKFRISNACMLLKQKELSVTFVAEAVGIADQKYFTRLFTKIMGVSPREYYKNCMDDDPFGWLKEKKVDFR